MSEKRVNFEYCDQLVEKFEQVCEKPELHKSSVYYTGVDLGTACVVVAVLDENYEPVAGCYKYADVVRDGMVVDYIGAVQIVREMKQELEEKLDTELVYAAAAIPPGTETVDSGAVENVVRGAGFTLSNLLDEPTAANEVLKIQNGAVVDIGGGTTGISIFKDGKVVYIADEPTGNVDPKRSYEIMNLLQEVNKMGTTVIVVTHEHNLVTKFNGRVIKLKRGKIVKDTAEEYYKERDKKERESADRFAGFDDNSENKTENKSSDNYDEIQERVNSLIKDIENEN